MKNTPVSGRVRRQHVLQQLEALWPVAKGSLSEVQRPRVNKGEKARENAITKTSHIYTYREKGKFHCRYVRPEFVDELKKAIENGRKLDQLLSGCGRELLEEMRKGST
jgi:anti-sigma28 factor (negative regulator of flagellin synthesis)